MKSYTVYAALHANAQSGEVWHYENHIDSKLVKLITPNNKAIIVTNRTIDGNFERLYNANINTRRLVTTNNPIILDEFSRKRLGIDKTGDKIQLKITPANLYDNVKYLAQHPNDANRIGFWVSIVILLISIVFSIILFIA